jgi:hypothetical protein
MVYFQVIKMSYRVPYLFNWKSLEKFCCSPLMKQHLSPMSCDFFTWPSFRIVYGMSFKVGLDAEKIL